MVLYVLDSTFFVVVVVVVFVVVVGFFFSKENDPAQGYSLTHPCWETRVNTHANLTLRKRTTKDESEDMPWK